MIVSVFILLDDELNVHSLTESKTSEKIAVSTESVYFLTIQETLVRQSSLSVATNMIV